VRDCFHGCLPRLASGFVGDPSDLSLLVSYTATSSALSGSEIGDPKKQVAMARIPDPFGFNPLVDDLLIISGCESLNQPHRVLKQTLTKRITLI
jgi:hypothetical protein